MAIGVGIGAAIAVGTRGAPSPPPSTFLQPSGTSGSLPPAATGTPTPSSSGLASPAASGAVRVDPSLLAVLPASVSGFVLAEFPEGEQRDAGTLDRTVIDRFTEAFVVDPATNQFAYGSVVALQPGVYTERLYRDWRATFDAGACSQAGGLAGTAQSTIAGRLTYIGHCASGLLTYHVRLDAPNVIVSVSSFGEARLGEQLVKGIRP